MPKGDRMGPEGDGPATGRGSGFCRGGDHPGYMGNSGTGRFGNSQGRGMGRGFHQSGPGDARTRHRGYGMGAEVPGSSGIYSKDTEKRFIGNEISFLKEQLKTMETRLEELEDEEK